MKFKILLLVFCLLGIKSFTQDYSYDDLINTINQLEQDEKYHEAKIIITEALNEYDKWFSLSKELIYVNEKLGLYEENLSIFNEAHQKGYFYFIHPVMPKYKSYKQFESFTEISQEDIKLLRKANENSNMIYEVQLPEKYDKEKSYPLIFILHGGGKNLEDVKEHWQTDILNKNYIKVYVQSYRHFDYETYGWGPTNDRLIRDFKKMYNEILELYRIDNHSILMGSISAGSNPVAELSLRSVIPVKGFILFCPNRPLFMKENKLDIIQNYNLKAFIVSGENDHFVPRQKEMIHEFDSLNISNNYTIVKNMRHQYPDDENYYINEGINYINSTEPINPELKKYIKNRIDIGYNKGISIGIIDSTGVAYYNYGTAFNNSIATPTKNTIYEIGSVTKIFTTSLYAILLDLEEIDKENKVGDYFKRSEFKGDIRNIKLIDLAIHISGLPSFPSNLDIDKPGNFSLGYEYKDFYNFLNSYKIPEEICYNYSNTGISLLAVIIERATGKTYRQLLNEYLFDYLKMNSTYLEVPKEQEDLFADGSSLGVEKDHWNLSSVFVPVGGVKSTSTDLIKFLSANMQLSAYEYSDALLKATKEKLTITDSESSATGWKIKEMNDEKYLWHSGNTGGFSGFVGFNTNNSKGVVVLANSNVNSNDIGWKLLDKKYKLGEPKNHVCFKLSKIINEFSIDSALSFYSNEIAEEHSDYILGELQLVELANAYVTKDLKVSEQIYEFALTNNPESLDLNIVAANFYITINKKDKAKLLLLNMQEKYPKNEKITYMIKEFGN